MFSTLSAWELRGVGTYPPVCYLYPPFPSQDRPSTLHQVYNRQITPRPTMDFDDNVPQLTPIVPTTHIRDITSNQTQRLLDRLLQELDDENTDLDNMEKIFAELSIKANTDYNVWSKKDMSVSLETGDITKYENNYNTANTTASASSATIPPQLPIESSGVHDLDLLDQLNRKNRHLDQNSQEYYNARRSLILSLLHREKKLSRHYESLITLYENLITYTAMNVRERREQNYGLYTNENYIVMDDKSPNPNQQPMNTIQSIQISQALKARAQALKQNTELLQILAQQKRQDMDMVKSLIASEAQELATVLEQADENDSEGDDGDIETVG